MTGLQKTVGLCLGFIAVVVGNALRPKYRRLYGRAAIGHSLWHALLPSVWVQIYLWAALILSFLARGVTLALRYPALERAVGR